MRESGMDQRQTHTGGHYRIRLRGTLPPFWSDWFGGMTLAYDGEGNTLLSGPLVDQAALHGVLDKARDLGMTLLEVSRVPTTGEDERGQGG